jgi:hypothetical protein
MRGVRFVSVESPVRKEPLPLTMARDFAERAEVELSEVEMTLHRAADVVGALDVLIGQLNSAELGAVAALVSRGLRDVAETEGKTLGELSLFLRLEPGCTAAAPPGPRSGACPPALRPLPHPRNRLWFERRGPVGERLRDGPPHGGPP